MDRGQGDPAKDQLVPVFENGKMLKEYSFEEVRQRATTAEPYKVSIAMPSSA